MSLFSNRIAKNNKANNLTLIMLLVLTALVRLPWIFMLPMQEAPDEFAHYWVIKFLKEHLCFPSAQEVFAGGPSAVYGSLPMLGYVPHLVFCLPFGSDSIALMSRFGSLAMGLLMVYAAYSIARELFGANRLLVLALPLMIIFHPQMAFVQSYANNDCTAAALAGLILLIMLRAIKYGLTYKRTVSLGFLAAWLVLSKYSGLSVLPAVVFALFMSSYVNGFAVITGILHVVIFASTLLVFSGWLFYRNYLVWDGDILGTKTMYKIWAQTFHREANFFMSPFKVIKEFRWWRMMFFSFWGLFGYMNKYIFRPLYVGYAVFLVLAVLGWLKSLPRIRFSKEDLASYAVWGSLLLTFVCNIAAMIWASAVNLGGPQGRYLFISEIPLMAMLLAGLSRYGRIGSILIKSLLVFNAGVCVYCWVYLYQSYGWHPNPLI